MTIAGNEITTLQWERNVHIIVIIIIITTTVSGVTCGQCSFRDANSFGNERDYTQR